jgi:hypothetical protein
LLLFEIFCNLEMKQLPIKNLKFEILFSCV